MVENVIRIKGGITIIACVSVKIRRNIISAKKYIWNPATCSCENSKYLGSTIDDSMITCNGIMDAVAKS